MVIIEMGSRQKPHLQHRLGPELQVQTQAQSLHNPSPMQTLKEPISIKAQIHQVYALFKPKPSPHLLPHLRGRRRGKWRWERQRRRASKSVQAARCPRRRLDYRRPCRVLRRIPASALKLAAAAWRGACYCCLYRRARGLLLRQRRRPSRVRHRRGLLNKMK